MGAESDTASSRQRGKPIALLALLAAALAAAGCGGSGGGGFGKDISAAEVVKRLKAEGLPIGKVLVYNATTDPNHLLGRPGGYTSKVAFVDTRIKQSGYEPGDIGEGGGVEVFANEATASSRAAYVRAFTENSALLAEYSYLRGRVFLRLSRELTPQQAGRYRHTFEQMRSP